mmetsp:Transcript_63535/g.124748  ORF Transcript_63535/g.124748 Transcript_63535/m.124748 type:complete len:694 (+) Transcript_63535:88-2169(+)
MPVTPWGHVGGLHSDVCDEHDFKTILPNECGPRRGLRNVGNTCYMNAAIQLLAANVDVCRLFTCEEPTEIVDENGASVVSAQPPKPLRWWGQRLRGATVPASAITDTRAAAAARVHALRGLVSLMLLPKTWSEPLPHRLHQALPAPFSGFEQQDAEECLALLLDSVEQGGYSAARVKEIFGGKLARPILCVACGDVTSPEPEEFTSLPLALARPGGGTDGLTVTRLLAEHLAEESLVDLATGLPSRECGKCASKQHALKSCVLQGPMPTHLLVSLKRFDHTGAKDVTPVHLDTVLALHPNAGGGSGLAQAHAKPFNPNVSPLPPLRGAARSAAARAGRAAAIKRLAAAASAVAVEEGGEEAKSEEAEEQGVVGSAQCDPGSDEAALYDLYAVVVHQGDSPNSGHYFTFARSSSDASAAAAAMPVNPPSTCNDVDSSRRRRQIFTGDDDDVASSPRSSSKCDENIDANATDGCTSNDTDDESEGEWTGWHRYDDEAVSPVSAHEWRALVAGTLTWRKGGGRSKSGKPLPATPYILCYRHRTTSAQRPTLDHGGGTGVASVKDGAMAVAHALGYSIVATKTQPGVSTTEATKRKNGKMANANLQADASTGAKERAQKGARRIEPSNKPRETGSIGSSSSGSDSSEDGLRGEKRHKSKDGKLECSKGHNKDKKRNAVSGVSTLRIPRALMQLFDHW